MKEEDLNVTDDVGMITDKRVAAKNKNGLVRRQVTTTKTLAGGDNMAYLEYSRNSGGQFTSTGRGGSKSGASTHHPFFKKHFNR
jgi:DNA excision repair protein ERCC-3